MTPHCTRPPVPPNKGGEPPVTRDFNRWLYGLILPGAVFLWSLFILANGRFYLVRLSRFQGAPAIDLSGPDAYAVGAFLFLASLLVHRVRFRYELYESPPRYWKRPEQLLLLLCFIPPGYLFWRLICLLIFGR